MKKLTAILMAFTMAGSSGLAMADRGKHHGGGHGDYHHGYKDRHYDKHYRHPGKGHGRWVKHPVHHHHRPHYRTRIYHDNDPYLPLGAALVGTAIGYSLGQAGPDCSSCAPGGYSQSAPANVAGCYRVERYPDGSEHRVELPTSYCF